MCFGFNIGIVYIFHLFFVKFIIFGARKCLHFGAWVLKLTIGISIVSEIS